MKHLSNFYPMIRWFAMAINGIKWRLEGLCKYCGGVLSVMKRSDYYGNPIEKKFCKTCGKRN